MIKIKISWEKDLDIKIAELKLRNKKWEKDWKIKEKKWDRFMKRIEYLKPIFVRNHVKRMNYLGIECDCSDRVILANEERVRPESVSKTMTPESVLLFSLNDKRSLL